MHTVSDCKTDDRGRPHLGPPVRSKELVLDNRPVILYDGSCALCRREIDHYRGLDTEERLLWIDIADSEVELAHVGITREQAMRRFHVRDARGRWQSGAGAFVELWAHLPYFRWLARVVRTLHLVGPLDALYGPFARWRLSRRCAEGTCVPRGGST